MNELEEMREEMRRVLRQTQIDTLRVAASMVRRLEPFGAETTARVLDEMAAAGADSLEGEGST